MSLLPVIQTCSKKEANSSLEHKVTQYFHFKMHHIDSTIHARTQLTLLVKGMDFSVPSLALEGEEGEALIF